MHANLSVPVSQLRVSTLQTHTSAGNIKESFRNDFYHSQPLLKALLLKANNQFTYQFKSTFGIVDCEDLLVLQLPVEVVKWTQTCMRSIPLVLPTKKLDVCTTRLHEIGRLALSWNGRPFELLKNDTRRAFHRQTWETCWTWLRWTLLGRKNVLTGVGSEVQTL